MSDMHVVPINDLQEHLTTWQCWCHPRRDVEEPKVWVHNAADGREAYERAKSETVQ